MVPQGASSESCSRAGDGRRRRAGSGGARGTLDWPHRPGRGALPARRESGRTPPPNTNGKYTPTTGPTRRAGEAAFYRRAGEEVGGAYSAGADVNHGHKATPPCPLTEPTRGSKAWNPAFLEWQWRCEWTKGADRRLARLFGAISFGFYFSFMLPSILVSRKVRIALSSFVESISSMKRDLKSIGQYSSKVIRLRKRTL